MSRNQRIKQIRKLTGMDQAPFADWMGVSSQQLVSDWETGNKTPTPQKVELAEMKLDKLAPAEILEALGGGPLEPSEILELAGCGSGKLAADNWHADTADTRDALHPQEMSLQAAARYEYDTFALVDDGGSEGARWFPVEVRCTGQN